MGRNLVSRVGSQYRKNEDLAHHASGSDRRTSLPSAMERSIQPGLPSLFLLALGLILASPRGADSRPPAVGITSFRLAFWEDAADVEGLLREGRNRARDDFLTVALGLRVDAAWRGTPCWLEAGLHVVTDTGAGKRADLASLRIGRTWPLGAGTLGVAAGALGVGKFGGEALQNGFHGLTHNATLELAHPRARMGPVCAVDLAWPLPGPLSLDISTVDAPAGFHQKRAGLLGDWRCSKALALEGWAGMSWHHHLHERLDPAFQDGLVYGGLADWAWGRGLHLVAWAVANQTRRDQSLVGLALGRGPAAGRQLSRLALRP
jgi:hypothetical protein